ncbi:hypothetical protein KKF59_01735 [Patescibacteria group bacterium]|nr:hypothetical protein [Patescibacteria group bacterium]MBU1629923.1 hypothetical protein [Patescibacteria group bacterium]MBU1907834.1 hypothetical protein [Patescibacteria group bacterium]
MAKRNVSEIETGAGYFMGFVSATMDVVREKTVPFAAIYRLATAGGRTTLGKIVDLAYADWLEEQPKPVEQQPQGGHPYRDAPTNCNTLPENHYRVRVTYAPLPSMDALKKEWGKDNVSDIFDGRPFGFHASCVNMDRTPGEKVFYVHDAGGAWESEEQIAWGAKQRNAAAPNGYRPATHEETYEFAKAHPELVDFVGLGSFAVRGVSRCVADVWQSGGQRILGLDWFDDRWRRRNRVLFVSK